ncbi:hypothetical protein FHX84_004772 [Clostridium beijerinckii]|nr:hypothetical protein [Clostridium beijerinckii]NYC68653.1 hypothetical protein [Clostridium beijerinckii]NYC91802.1 hypothetical protein [Clostridium beijerinckii]
MLKVVIISLIIWTIMILGIIAFFKGANNHNKEDLK